MLYFFFILHFHMNQICIQNTDSLETVSEEKGLLSPVTNPYRLLLWFLITNECNTKIGAEQCAKDTTLGEIILSVFENGVGATELHFT